MARDDFRSGVAGMKVDKGLFIVESGKPYILGDFRILSLPYEYHDSGYIALQTADILSFRHFDVPGTEHAQPSR